MVPTCDGLRSAAARHLEDAEHHFGAGNFEQAAHLLGFAPECSRKAQLPASWHKRLGHRMDGAVLDALVALDPRSVCALPVDDALVAWTPEIRYTATGSVRAGDVRRQLEAARRMTITYLAQGWALSQ